MHFLHLESKFFVYIIRKSIILSIVSVDFHMHVQYVSDIYPYPAMVSHNFQVILQINIG